MKTIAFIAAGILQLIAGFLLGVNAPQVTSLLSPYLGNLGGIIVTFLSSAVLLLSGAECLIGEFYSSKKGGEK